MKCYGFKSLRGILLLGLLSIGCASAEMQVLEEAKAPLLTGEWVITEQTAKPLFLVPSCKPIQEGTTFKFTPKTLEVYLGRSGVPCNVYNYVITDNTISIMKYDMIWLCKYKLTTNYLTLISSNFLALDDSNKSVILDKRTSSVQDIMVTFKKK